MRNKKNKGFTLIELLVVIAIIGLLASIVLVALNGARQKSRDTTRLADVRQLASAFESYFNDANSYPTGTAYTTNGVLGIAGGFTTINGFNFTPTYLGVIPTAPTPYDGTCSSTSGVTTRNDFVYAAPAAGTTYTLSFCLGAATGGYAAGTHYLTPAGIQ